MTFSRKALLTAVVTLGALTVAQDVQAGCGRGGYRGGYSRGYSSRSYSSGHYSPGYRSSYGYSQSGPSVRIIQSQRTAPQQFVSQQQFARPQQQQQFAQPQQQQQFAPQQNAAPQQQQQIGQQQPQQQQFAPQQNAAPRQQQQINQQQFTQQRATAPQQQPAPQQSAPAPAQSGNVQMTALQALGGIAPPQAAPAQTAPVQAQTLGYIGNWTATLGNGANVQLALQNDGSFSWSATNKTGTASSFSGRFTIGNGSLALIRGNDNQRLEGNMTNSGQDAFSFKVAGNNAAAISFSRN